MKVIHKRLAGRLARYMHAGYINYEEANTIWLRETGLEIYWPEWA